MTVGYKHFVELNTVGTASLHPHRRIAAPVRQHSDALLGDDEHDATRLARLIRNDCAPKKVRAHGNPRGEGPKAADDIAPIDSLELRNASRPGCVRRTKVTLGSEHLALRLFAAAATENDRVRGRQGIAPAAGRMPARELHDHADVGLAVRA